MSAKFCWHCISVWSIVRHAVYGKEHYISLHDNRIQVDMKHVKS